MLKPIVFSLFAAILLASISSFFILGPIQTNDLVYRQYENSIVLNKNDVITMDASSFKMNSSCYIQMIEQRSGDIETVRYRSPFEYKMKEDGVYQFFMSRNGNDFSNAANITRSICVTGTDYSIKSSARY